MDKRAAWDRFWSYDRLSSFGTGAGSGNYGEPIAAGWRAFFASLPKVGRVLDIATGNGAIAVMAIEAGDGLRVTGADLAEVKPAAFVSGNRNALKRVRFLAGAAAEDLPLEEGVYIQVLGPSYETPAEIRMAERMGADAIGMSTAVEVIAARARGVRCLAFSAISNPAAGTTHERLSHADVIAATREIAGNLERLVEGVVTAL